MEYIIFADNIKCDGCVSTIRDVLEKISGVDSVSVDIESGRITINADDHLREQIVTALSTSGYPEKSRT